ncbi:TonB-dependent receptor [Brevundimonas sp.]|uniref:TonB-dependent receptor n=1 Tax=Brevundimonas sp. TaxID=1871086 RepID=UPI00391AECA8
MSRTTSYRIGLMSAAAACALAAGAAQAQEATQVDEIIVTAQLRAQNPIDVPFALTAYDGDFLRDLGVQEFEEMSAFVPGFLVQNQSPNNPGFVMRGITSDSGAATAEPRVSVYQDGVSISKSRGSYVELFDIERMEIAKGPQSTLYGRGALIGAVNIVQRRAEPGVFDAEARVGMGDLGYRLAEGMINMPLGETSAIRFSTRLKSRDGYVENLSGGDDYNSIDTEAFRLSAAFEPASGFSIDVIANYQTDRASGTPFTSMAYAPANPVTGAPLGPIDPWAGAALTPGADFDGGQSLGLDRDVWGVTGLLAWELSPMLTLNSITAYREFDSYETFDADGVSLPILTAAEEAYGEQFSQELRLNFEAGPRVTGFFGAGYFHEEGYQRTPTQFDERMALAQLSGFLDGGLGGGTLPAAAYPGLSQLILSQLLAPLGAGGLAPAIAANLKPAHIETPTNASELTSWDVFGDMTFQATDRLELSAGLRYTTDEKTTGYAAQVDNGRSTLGGILGAQAIATQIQQLVAIGTPEALTQAAALNAQLTGLIGALATPGFATLPGLPLFGLTSQPTANNGDMITQDHEDDGFTWRLTARYAVSDDVNVYANYARGRRPEVLSVGPPSAPGGAPAFNVIEAETVDSFEIGAKMALMDRRLRLDGAVYFYDYQNFQTTVQEGTQFITTNAGEAESYGFEGQVFYAASDALDLFATYGFNHSRFGNGIYEGNSFRLSPDHMASVGAVWRVRAGAGAFEIQPTYTWQSEVFFDDDNDLPALQANNLVPDLIQDEFQDSYGLLSLRLRYAPDSANWGVELFGDNLLDEEFIKDAGNTGDALGMPTFIPGRPRTWGINLSLRY